MESIIGHRIYSNGAGVLRGQQHNYPAKIDPSTSPSHPWGPGINPIIHYFSSGFIGIFFELHQYQTPFPCMYSIYRNYAFFPFQVAFGIDLNAVNDPDSLFPAAIKECLVAPVWCLSHPLHAVDFTTYGYQNTVVAAVHFLRDTGKKIMDERRKAILNGDDVPSDILTYILKSAPEDTQLDYEEVLDHFITFFIAGRI